MTCKFCGYEFADDCGKYGCPNCLGEGFKEMSKTKQKSDKRVKKYRAMMVPDHIHSKIKRLARSHGLRLNVYLARLLRQQLTGMEERE
tara:strand:+ start:132 stop:395 length:264 start_codon:yes stop_codon:yes gene_type:complete